MKIIYTIINTEKGTLAMGAAFENKEEAETTAKDISKATGTNYHVVELGLFPEIELSSNS